MSETSENKAKRDRAAEGMATRRAVLGDEYVDRALNGADWLTEDFQALVTEWCWGEIWERPGLERRDRSLLNIGMLAALGRRDELKIHLRGALRNGLTPVEIKEALMQVSVYCGVPAAIDAFKMARLVMEEEGVKNDGVEGV